MTFYREAVSRFLTYLKTESQNSNSGDNETEMARKNFYTARVLKIPWKEDNETYLNLVKDSLNLGRAKVIKEAISTNKVRRMYTQDPKQDESISEEDKQKVMKSFKEFRELMSSVKFSPEILSMADQTATETAMKKTM